MSNEQAHESQKRTNRVKTQGKRAQMKIESKEIRAGFPRCQTWVKHDHDLPVLQMLCSLKHILTILEGVYQHRCRHTLSCRAP